MTLDLDIVHRRTPENVSRLLQLLTELDAYVREPANCRLRPDASLLLGQGQVNLATGLGPLDACLLLRSQGWPA